MDKAAVAAQTLFTSGLTVAPHVAGQLATLGELDHASLLEVARQLTREQRMGFEPLPLALPVSHSMIERTRTRLLGSTAALRRLLLAAALSTSPRVDVILAAAGCDPGIMFTAPVDEMLIWGEGRFRFRCRGVRDVLIATSGDAERTAIHEALSRALRIRGDRGRAAWHRSQNPATATPKDHRELLHFADQLLAAGSAREAFAAGIRVAVAGTGELRSSGCLIAARSALVLGCFTGAITLFAEVRRESALPAIRTIAEAGMQAAQEFLEGPAAFSSLAEHLNYQAALLRRVAVTDSDRLVTTGLHDIAAHWNRDRDVVDAVHATLLLALESRAPYATWQTEIGRVSPLIEGYLRGQQIGMLLHSRQLDIAAAALRHTISHFPLTHLAGGAVQGALRMVHREVPELADTYIAVMRSIRPRRRMRFRVEGALVAHRLHDVTQKEVRSYSAPAPAWIGALTPRQLDVVLLVGQGLKNREVGAALNISERTVEVHIARVFQTVGIATRAQLLLLLHQHSEHLPTAVA